MRINKYMADRGIASRREADRLIEAGRVTVNGTPAVIGQDISEVSDVVEIVGERRPFRYLAYYKPRGIITHSPAPHETDIATQLASHYNITGVSPVGRLDKDSEGLMLLSDDGRITKPLTDPERGIEKEYLVTVDKPITPRALTALSKGVNIEGYVTKPAQTEKVKDTTFRLTITEGKKHQIRRMCAALGYQVTRLTRISVATVTLGELTPNQFRYIRKTELHRFLTALGVRTDG